MLAQRDRVTTHPSGSDFIDTITDLGSVENWDEPIAEVEWPASYRDDLDRAREQSGSDESIITGRASIRGEPVALIVGNFTFLGGSIGTASARRIVLGLRRATSERLPVLAATCSGGTRMQEGTRAFVKMVEIVRAVIDHRNSGLPYLVYLRHPTTGGAFASWGSLGQVTWAEPGALIGFLGPRVFEAISGSQFPAGVQRAENLAAVGVIDEVVPIAEVATRTAQLLRLLRATSERRHGSNLDPAARRPAPRRAVWDCVRLTRRPDRPGVQQLLDHAAEDVVVLSGTGTGELDAGLVLALARFDGVSCVLIGQDRVAQAQKAIGPAALRVARRGMRLAQELRLPVVAVIDTAGADLSADSEENALAGEIARCIADFVSLSVPSVSVLLGEGSGGGALALFAAQRVIAAENAWLAPLSPEGAAAIAARDPAAAPQMAEKQRIGAWDLLACGIVHRVVSEPVAAHLDPAGFVRQIARACVDLLGDQVVAVLGPVPSHALDARA